jgi:simple sugar transport system ATP-binding protein
MNCILGDYHRPPYSGKFGFLQHKQIEAHAAEVVEAYDIRPPSTSLLAARFSGGNAQKLVVARELERHTEVLLLAQPTRGVDIGAIEFIHQQIVRARDMGIAVLLVSADLNEIMSLSDRILVMYEGRITGELAQADATAEKLGLLMAGATLESESAA